MSRRTSHVELAYTATLSPAQAKQHHTNTRFPSGRPSKGGANRSSNIKRVINLTTRHVAPCSTCAGVTPDVLLLTTFLGPACTCKPHPDAAKTRPLDY